MGNKTPMVLGGPQYEIVAKKNTNPPEYCRLSTLLAQSTFENNEKLEDYTNTISK